MENKFGRIISQVGKNAKEVLDKTKDLAVQAADQNDDGKFNMEDVSKIAESMGEAMKKGAASLKESAEEKAKELELKALQPIFLETLEDIDFHMPKLIRIVERDKRRLESEVCKGAIGYGANQKDLHYLNIYRDSIEKFGITFFPNIDSEFYYVNPVDRDDYISLDDYFEQLKVARINELQRIAQDLGAKKFQVTYKEEKSSFSEKQVNFKGKINGKGQAEAVHEQEQKKYAVIDIAVKMECPGHSPIEPQLKYLKYDTTVQNLIELRMHQMGPLSKQAITIKLSNSSGLKVKDAIKIDAVLNGLKCSGNASVESAAQGETRKYLEYEIEF